MTATLLHPAARVPQKEAAMPDRLSILCVHGIGHGDRDPLLVPSWTSAIEQDLHRWNPDLEVEFEFLRYDSLFDHMPLNAATYAEHLQGYLQVECSTVSATCSAAVAGCWISRNKSGGPPA